MYFFMKVVFIQVGRTVDKHLIALAADYAERITHYLPFEVHTVPDLKNNKTLSFEQQKIAEGVGLQQFLKAGDHVVLLDEGGKEFSSIEFANHIQRRLNGGGRRLVFIIGGPYGFSQDIYGLAQEKISLSRMTFSHQMVRLFFIEQLYRAMTILNGEPYHHS